MQLKVMPNLSPGEHKGKDPGIQACIPRVPEVGGRGGSLYIYVYIYNLLPIIIVLLIVMKVVIIIILKRLPPLPPTSGTRGLDAWMLGCSDAWMIVFVFAWWQIWH